MKKLLLLISAIGLCGMAWAEPQLKIIPLRHRFAQDVLPAIQPLVGAGGVASAVGNNLLVRASPERIAAIEQAIALLDVERKTLRITVSRSGDHQGSGREVGVSGSVRRGDVMMRGPDRSGRVVAGGVVELGQRDASTSERASEFVSVLEGEHAVISVGQSVPFTETWVVLMQRYARVQETVQFRDITTGFAVRPRPIGDEVELEIAPRVANISQGVIEFQQLTTTVRVRPGQWLDLGGTMQSHDEVSREIFSGNAASARSSSQLWIRVE